MVDLIRPIEFGDMLRRWCLGTSNRWCEMSFRSVARPRSNPRQALDPRQPEPRCRARIADDFPAGLHWTTLR